MSTDIWNEIMILRATVNKLKKEVAKSVLKLSTHPELRPGEIAEVTKKEAVPVYEITERTVSTEKQSKLVDVKTLPGSPIYEVKEPVTALVDDEGERFILPIGTRILLVKDMIESKGVQIRKDDAGTITIPDGSQILDTKPVEPNDYFHTSDTRDTYRIYLSTMRKKIDAAGFFYQIMVAGHGAVAKTFSSTTTRGTDIALTLETDGQGNVLSFEAVGSGETGEAIYHELYIFFALKNQEPDYEYPYIERKTITEGGVPRFAFVSSVWVDAYPDALYKNCKLHRTDHSEKYTLNFYRDWNPTTGKYNDLVYTYEGTYFSAGQYNYIYWKQPRTGMTNKASLIAAGTHPYDDPTEAFYIEIVEIHDDDKTFGGKVGATSPAGEGNFLYTDYVVGSGPNSTLPYWIIHQNQDRVLCTNAVRNEKIIDYMTRVTGPYNYSFWCLQMENTGGLPVVGYDWSIPFKSRKSSFYGTVKKYPWVKWELTNLAASISSTRFTFTQLVSVGSMPGFNEDADAHIVYTNGLGEVPGWTGLFAEYYCSSVLVFTNLYGNCYVLRAHANWNKWDGSAWIVASSGDAIVNPYVSDRYTVNGITRTRTSNQTTMSSTLT